MLINIYIHTHIHSVALFKTEINCNIRILANRLHLKIVLRSLKKDLSIRQLLFIERPKKYKLDVFLNNSQNSDIRQNYIKPKSLLLLDTSCQVFDF